MSIKSLFNNKTATVQSANSGSTDVESKDFVLTRAQRDETFLPFIDFSSASNFAKFGSAEEYYKNSIERIYNEYPYDGSEKEKLIFELSSSYLDKYIFDEKYPKTNGYVNFTGPAIGGTKTSGYGSNSTPQYIYARGGIHVAEGMTNTPLYKTFDKSVVYDDSKKRVSSLKMDIPSGITTEFWLKKTAFDNSKTEKEVILDLWNGNLSSSADYGRFTLALSGTAAGTDTFIVTMQSGTTGFFEQSIGTATVTTSSLANWHHYAFSFISASSGVTSRIYVDGDLNENKSLGSTGVNEIGGLINGYIGALQTAPSGNVYHGVNLIAGGTLSASIDDFRFWKTRRTSKQIYNNWYRHVGGGTNTDDANINLGVYYKFNEGIVGNNTTDSVVLDYSGRLVNGSWTGYVSGMRSTSSAFTESGLLTSEPKDPIIYSAHPDVSSLKTSLMSSGKAHDNQNPALLYYKVPQWIRDSDPSTGNSTKQLYQIIASYFDTLHAQITALPYLKNKVYPSSSYKALPFADRLLEDKGLVVSNLFADSNILEAFGDRDLNKVQFEKKLTDIKNQIYTNIYNNLESIYKHKGTEGSIRNMLRCFGIDDEIVKLNIYTDQGMHYFSDSFKHTSLNKKYINFNKINNLNASLYQTSSVNHSLTYISGSSAEKLEQYNAFSSEVSIIVPKKLGPFDSGHFPTTFQSASVFGVHQAKESSADYTWATQDLANFQVYLVRDESESSSGKFLVKDYGGNFTLESPVYKEIYSNEPWNISVRVKPEDYPIAGNVVTSSNRNYILEFYGVNHAFDTVKNEFFLSQSLNYNTGSAYLSNPKRFYVGAHRTNFTGSTLEQTDIKVGRFNLWYDYVGNDEVKLHNRDVSSKGNKRTARPSTIFGKNLEQVEIPSYELLAADWDFETVSTSDSSGEFIVVDASSGSTDTRYGWIDNIVRREHRARAIGFPASSTNVISNEIVYSSKKELPEISYSADGVTIKGNQEEFFIEDEDVSDNFFALEKSMYQVVSEEMMRTLSTAQEMSNLMGEAVERYRLEYKKLNHVRRMFFEDVEEDPDFDRFTEYFKWIDSSVSYMVSQMFPMSVRFSKGISDIVESHLFERNKYQNKFPLLTTHTATEGSAQGVGLSKYRWEFGHAPIEVGAGDNDNCLWRKTREERTDISERETIKDVINNRNNAQATKLAKPDRTVYDGSTFAIRRFSKPVDMNANMSQILHPGINYNLQKNRDYVWSATHRGSQLTSLGIPKNVLIVGAGPGQGIELPANTCNDIEIPNEKKKFNTTVFVGKFAVGGQGGSFAEINDSASYNFAIKGAHNLPFDIFSGSIGAYNTVFSSGYRSDAYVTNIHSDTTNFSNDIPLQGPFTNQWVGGHQSRHIELNRFDVTLRDDETGTAPPNNLDNQYTRPEGWLLKVVENDGGDSDGAFGIVDPQYGVTKATNIYPDAAKKGATLYRDGRAKRPFNISNIQTTTSSANHGNYKEKYEVVSAMGKHENNLFFRKNSNTHTFVPTSIGNILPETTNYQTLVGISTNEKGNVFGDGESSIINDTLETFGIDSVAKTQYQFPMYGTTGDTLTVQTNDKSHTIEVADPNIAPSNSISDLLLYTGSNGTAFGASTIAIGSGSKGSYSGLGPGPFSMSWWFYDNQDGDNSQLRAEVAGGTIRHIIQMDTDVKVIVKNTANTDRTADFNTNLYSSPGWKHFVWTLDTTSGIEPKLWLNGVQQTRTGWSALAGTPPTIDTFKILVSNQNRMQDIVVWKGKLLTQADIDILYAKGNWRSPATHPSASTINDWYKFGYETYWNTLGYSNGDTLNSRGSAPYTVSSSFGSGSNHLTISADEDQDFTFTTGFNPFGFTGPKSVNDYANEVSSSLSGAFPNFTVANANSANPRTQTMRSNNNGALGFLVSEVGSTFTIDQQNDGSLSTLEKGYLNTATVVTASATRTVISSRFSAPGSVDTMTYGFLDAYSQEYSVYNNLNYRNLSVRGIAVRVSSSADGTDFYNFGGSGEDGTIRVNDHRNNRDGLKPLLSRHSGKFGIDPRYASELGSEPLEQDSPDPSFHKQQRNENRRPSDTSTITVPVLITRHDSAYINSPIPRSDFQYKWVTSSLGSNYSITSGKQRMYGYAHPTGILSSSVTINGDSGFVPAITFPTASEIFGE